MPTLATKDGQGMFMAVLFVIVRKRKIKRGRRDRGGEERKKEGGTAGEKNAQQQETYF